MALEVKICGLNDAAAVDAAVKGGASLTGFVFFPPSPRYLDVGLAADLAGRVPVGIVKVGLFVDATDDFIARVVNHVPLDMLQLHGNETPKRAQELKLRFNLPIMKALAISAPGDTNAVRGYEPIADRLLFDARPPKDATRPGGNALAFDWQLLVDLDCSLPWLLAGGITIENLADAVRVSGARGIDVSSGVEDRPGVKSVAKIKAFLDLARIL